MATGPASTAIGGQIRPGAGVGEEGGAVEEVAEEGGDEEAGAEAGGGAAAVISVELRDTRAEVQEGAGPAKDSACEFGVIPGR